MTAPPRAVAPSLSLFDTAEELLPFARGADHGSPATSHSTRFTSSHGRLCHSSTSLTSPLPHCPSSLQLSTSTRRLSEPPTSAPPPFPSLLSFPPLLAGFSFPAMADPYADAAYESPSYPPQQPSQPFVSVAPDSGPHYQPQYPPQQPYYPQQQPQYAPQPQYPPPPQMAYQQPPPYLSPGQYTPFSPSSTSSLSPSSLPQNRMVEMLGLPPTSSPFNGQTAPSPLHQPIPSQSMAGDPTPTPKVLPSTWDSPKSAFQQHRKRWICAVLLLLVVIIVVVVVAVVESKKSSSPSSSPSPVTVMGSVASASGVVLSGMTVGGGPCNSATTSSSGTFSLTCTPSDGSTEMVFSVTGSASYTTQVVSVPVVSGLISYFTPVQMNSWTQTQTFAPTVGVSVTVAAYGGSSIFTVPALTSAQVTAQHAPSSAVFRVAVIPVDTAPGSMHSASPDSANGGATALQSGGMFYFDLVDAATQLTEWSLPSGMSVAVSLSGQTLSNIPQAGSTNWFSFDPKQGKWTNPVALAGFSTHPFNSFHHRMAVMAHLNATHESEEDRTHAMRLWQANGMTAGANGYWNSDRAYLTSCVITTISSQGGGACAGSSVKAVGPDNLASRATSQSDGTTCLEGAQTRSSIVSVAGGGTATVSFPAAPGSCSNPSSCQHVTTTLSAPSSACPVQKPTTPPNEDDCIQALEAFDQQIETLAQCTTPAQCCSEAESYGNQLLGILQGVCSELAQQYPDIEQLITELQQTLQELQQDC